MNVLIIGLGSIAKKHIEALAFLKVEVKLYALRSNLNATNELGVNNIYSLDNLTPKFDFAIISNPTYLHYKFIEKLANKQIPLFIEKPAVNSLINIDRLIDVVEKNKKITYVACNLRFHPCITFLKNKIDSETLRINEVNVYCGSYLPDWRPGKNFRTIYSANAEMGGGVHLDLFHELDYITWLFGLPIQSQSILKNNSSLEIDATDYANYVLEYETFVTSIILNYYRKKAKREIEIVFEKETWTIDLIKNEIKNDDGDVLFQSTNFNITDTYYSQFKYFIDCLQSSKKPMNSLQESIKVLEICMKK
jgi:predicted dehydrogenase